MYRTSPLESSLQMTIYVVSVAIVMNTLTARNLGGAYFHGLTDGVLPELLRRYDIVLVEN